jgi:hypothetical protein
MNIIHAVRYKYILWDPKSLTQGIFLRGVYLARYGEDASTSLCNMALIRIKVVYTTHCRRITYVKFQ